MVSWSPVVGFLSFRQGGVPTPQLIPFCSLFGVFPLCRRRSPCEHVPFVSRGSTFHDFSRRFYTKGLFSFPVWGVAIFGVFPPETVGLCPMVVELPKPLVEEGLMKATLRFESGNVNPAENRNFYDRSSMITRYHPLTLDRSRNEGGSPRPKTGHADKIKKIVTIGAITLTG